MKGNHTTSLLPARRSMLRALFEAPQPLQRKREKPLTPSQVNAAYVQWLDIHEHLSHGQIAERLSVKRSFVYDVLEHGFHMHVQPMKPPEVTQ